MQLALWLALLAVAIAALAHLRAPLWTHTAGMAAALLGATVQGALAGWLAAPLMAGLAACAVALHVPALRRHLVTRRVFALFRRLLPPMSDTESEALHAGTVGWEAELLGGRPDWTRLLAVPRPVLDDTERAFLDGPVEALCAMLDDWQISREVEGLPPEVWAFLKRERFFGMIIPEHHGGLGLSALGHSAVVTKISSRSPTAGVVVMVPNSLGPAELLLHYGTDEQQAHYLPRLARGDEIPCFALTGPSAGSDAAAIPDTGVVCRGEHEGETGVLGVRLDFDKRYITLAPVATLVGVAFRLRDPDHLLGAEEEPGITLALVPADAPGVEIGRRHRPMGMAFYNGPIRGRDVFVPVDRIIGGPQMAGRGWTMLMESLAAGRSISLPALSTASAKLAARATGAYAAVREQFHVPIGQFEGVQEALARIGGNAYLMDAARTLTTSAVDLGERPSVASAIVKYHLTERMRRTVDDALDVHGGRGICRGPRNYLAPSYLGVPVAITVEGANILSRSLIIFGQGAIRCHPFVLAELEAAGNNDAEAGLVDFDRAVCGHLRFALGNAARALALALSGGRLASRPAPGRAGWYYQQLARTSAALAITADMSLLLLGGRLKRMERLSARLGDVLSHLYLASAVLKRYADDGYPDADRPLVDWACHDCLDRIQAAFNGFLANLPVRWAAALLRAIVFPLGRPYPRPSDRAGSRVAKLLQRPSPARERLTAGIYTGGADDPVGRVEHALARVVEAERGYRRLKRALRSGVVTAGPMASQLAQARARGVLDADEAARIEAAEAARAEAIAVDDFAPADFGRRSAPLG